MSARSSIPRKCGHSFRYGLRAGAAARNRSAVAFAALVCSAPSTFAQAPECGIPGDARCEAWTARRDHYPYDNIRALAASPTGDRVFTTGASTTTNRINNFITIAHDRDG